MMKASCILVLENPPQGPSVADGYAERCNQGAEIRMKNTMSQIERRKQQSASQLEKEKKKIVKDLKKINMAKFKRNQSKNVIPNLLETEKTKLKEKFGNVILGHRDSDCDISEDSADDRSDCNSEDGSVDSLQEDLEKSQHKAMRSYNRHKTSYQERSREDRLTNLHRRFSAQIHTEQVVDVKRVQKQNTGGNKSR